MWSPYGLSRASTSGNGTQPGRGRKRAPGRQKREGPPRRPLTVMGELAARVDDRAVDSPRAGACGPVLEGFLGDRELVAAAGVERDAGQQPGVVVEVHAAGLGHQVVAGQRAAHLLDDLDKGPGHGHAVDVVAVGLVAGSRAVLVHDVAVELDPSVVA